MGRKPLQAEAKVKEFMAQDEREAAAAAAEAAKAEKPAPQSKV
jgi:hypothetical protein